MVSLSTAKTAAILLIGDELLSAKVQDQNGALLIVALRQMGVELTEIVVLPDRVDRIVEAVQRVTSRNDCVFSSGGIGPTHDDKTMLAMGQAFGETLERRAELVDIINTYHHDGGSAGWMKMAEVPTSCELLYHEGTRWPCFKVHNVFVLPGIPQIFRRQFEFLKGHLECLSPFVVRTLYHRRHEGVVAPILSAADEKFAAVSFGSYPVWGRDDYEVRITIESRDPAAVDAATQWLLEHFEHDDVFEARAGSAQPS